MQTKTTMTRQFVQEKQENEEEEEKNERKKNVIFDGKLEYQ